MSFDNNSGLAWKTVFFSFQTLVFCPVFMFSEHLFMIGFIIIVEILCHWCGNWAGLQWVRGNEILEVKSGETEIIKHATDDQTKQVCGVGALTPISYTLYFFTYTCSHGFSLSLRERSENFKNWCLWQPVEEIFPSQGTTISWK